jgi:3-deoxy-7-phosphoheptulonate synthase
MKVEYRLAARQPDIASAERPVKSTVVRIGPHLTVGGGELTVIAGPCAVENQEMLSATAQAVRSAGAVMLRGGAFKPRTSPYAFRGLGESALAMLADARAESGLAIVTEIMDASHLPAVVRVADVLQIGARNMQNFTLLAAVGETGIPVVLKRGMSATISELLMAAEYLMAHGNPNVILCERGIRTFETATRNTMDVAAVPVLKRETHLPVLVDPSHAGGRADLVEPLSMAAVAAGADGLLIEVHPDPATALSDGPQSLSFGQFAALMRKLEPLARLCQRPLSSLHAEAWTNPLASLSGLRTCEEVA